MQGQYGTPQNRALIDIERDPKGPEYGAALYESYAADHEYQNAHIRERRSMDFAGYARAAENAAVAIEYDFYDREYEGGPWL
jgi:hypothetical protein